MQLRKSSVLMMSAPALAGILLGALLIGGIVPNTTDKLGENLGASGYVVISVVRDGVEVYHHEDHNQITEEGIDFLVNQISGTATTDNAKYIALTNQVPDEDDDVTALNGELNDVNNLGRQLATLAASSYTVGANDQDTSFIVTTTFTANNTQTNVQGAGLFTDATSGEPDTILAVNDFSSVNLAADDQLTISWTIDLGILGLDA